MKNFTFFIIIPIFFTGCVNKEGISLKYYPDCKEYYDYYGVYHEKCENNVYNFDSKKQKKQELPAVCLDCE